MSAAATTRMREVGTLAQALVAFQAEAPPIGLDKMNPHFRSKYASLAGIMETVRPVLAKHGLAITQHAVTEPVPGLRTWLIHTAGEHLDCGTVPLAVDKAGPQAQGSALTYARRYGVLAALGLVGDDDDDANAAQQSAPARTPRAAFQAPATVAEAEGDPFQVPPAASGGPKSTEAQIRNINRLRDKLAEQGVLTVDVVDAGMTAAYGTSLPQHLSKADASDLIERLKAKAGEES